MNDMKFKRTLLRTFKILGPTFLFVMALSVVVYAATADVAVDTSKIDTLAGMISKIFQKIGGVVIFIGGLQIAWGVKSENPDTKSAGIKTAAAGALVTAVATAYTTFIS
jgi:hypothetical protein